MTDDALSAAVELDARAVGSRCGGSRAGAWLVLGVSGAFGFYLGFRVYPNWQVAVETAQVVAGIVKYPAGNPFYIYHTKLWTILHQICAVALLAGVSEITLSRVLSGVIGMVSIQALSLCTYAFCRRPWLSIGSGLFVLATRSASNGANYPILLMATEHTYGALGLSTFALAGAALGAGLPGLGGFLVGLMPSIHPSLGLWLWIIVLLAVLWDVAYARAEFARAFWWFAAGAAITTISLVVQLTVTYDVPKIDPAEAAKYFYAFVNFWDVHRSSVNINGLAVLVNRVVLGVGILWLLMFRSQLPRQAAFLLRMMVIGAAVGIAMAYASWIPPDRIPLSVLTVMPTRVLNFNGMIVVAALIGLIARYEEKWSAALLLVLLLGGLLLSNRSMLWEWNVAAPWAGLQRG
ncbi:MAG TPA: hypothetical protein VJP86_07265, partial [Vicinamibacterales bacterium]|nr:hypothetical protein [Vicinamibacterales bacterium]